ncbi:MAG: PepSY domain-containing protein [Methylophilus sp.]|nr:PepSY domain-containing protein [Methylophilus sp.]
MMSARTKILRLLRHWHARFGAIAALFFLFLATSGLALNHTDILSLSKQELNATWLTRWYGLKPSVPKMGFVLEEGYLVEADGRWLLNGQFIAHNSSAVVGALTWHDLYVVASPNILYLYTKDGQLVDKLTESALPEPKIEAIGKTANEQQLLLKGLQKTYISEDGLNWLPANASGIAWAQAKVLPADIAHRIKPLLLPTINAERVLLDVHSGRIFGYYGPLLMDIVAIILMLLSVTGVWMYWRTIHRSTK